MKSLLAIVGLVVVSTFTGCQTADFDCDSCSDCFVKSNTNDRVGVLVACTRVDPAAYGGWNGACPGTDVDVNFVASQMVKEQIPYTLLFNEKANSANVINACKAAARSLKNGGLLFVYFSGHGGQLPQLQSANETDGQDETICLYDGQLRDDVVWSLLTSIPAEKNIKVFMVTDCCNSGTNFRNPHNFARSLRTGRYVGEAIKARGVRSVPNLLHWGGCGDGESSYGSGVGGAFTLTWKRALAQRMTYRQTQSYISGRIQGQKPTYATLGNFNLDKVVFSK